MPLQPSSCRCCWHFYRYKSNDLKNYLHISDFSRWPHCQLCSLRIISCHRINNCLVPLNSLDLEGSEVVVSLCWSETLFRVIQGYIYKLLAHIKILLISQKTVQEGDTVTMEVYRKSCLKWLNLLYVLSKTSEAMAAFIRLCYHQYYWHGLLVYHCDCEIYDSFTTEFSIYTVLGFYHCILLTVAIVNFYLRRIYTVFRKKTSTHIFFHISINDVWI